MGVRDYQEDPPIAGHRKPEVVRIRVVTSIAGIGCKIDVLLVLVISFLCVDSEICCFVRAAVSRPKPCINKNFLCIIWYCIRYFV